MDAPTLPPAESAPRPKWRRIAREWFAGPNLPYLCLLVICALSLLSRIVLLWR